MLRIETLGGFRVEHTERAVGALLNYRLRCALLSHLAVERETTRDRAAALLWPDSDPAAARHSLSQALYELRRVLGSSWMEASGDHLRITGEVEVDVAGFETAVAREDWAAALALYGGPFLEGEDFGAPQPFEEWTAQMRARLAGAHRKARRGFIERCLAEKKLPAAVAAAREWVAIDPLEDEAQHRLISLLAATGQRADALRQYDRYERLLKDELDLVPLDETRELVRRLRAGEDAAPVVDAAGVPREPLPAPPARQSRRPLRTAAAAFGTLLVIASAGVVLSRGDEDTPAAAELPPHRIAVLPLRSIGSGEEVRLVAAGLTDGLIEQLGGVSQLDVLSANTVLAYADSAPEAGEIGRRHGVGTLVAGTVQASGDTLRVRINMTDAASGALVESHTFEEPSGELFQLQDALAGQVADWLRVRLGERIELSRRRSNASDVQAWEDVQRAMALVRQVSGLRARSGAAGIRTAPWLAEADAALERAARRDPGWTVPWIDRGWVALQRARAVTVADTAAFRTALAQGLEYADRALALDPQDPRALELRGSLLARLAMELASPAERDSLIALADTVLHRAVQQDPTRADAWNSLALLSVLRGDFESAETYAQTALEEDAYLSGVEWTRFRLFNAAWNRGDFPAARRWCGSDHAQFAASWRFAFCRLMLMAGDSAEPAAPDSAWRLLHRIEELEGSDFSADTDPYLPIHHLALVAQVLARAGMADSARAVLSDAGERATREGFVAEFLFDQAKTHVALGERDAALRALEQFVALESALSTRRFIARLHTFAPLRGDPRFRAVIGDTTTGQPR